MCGLLASEGCRDKSGGIIEKGGSYTSSKKAAKHWESLERVAPTLHQRRQQNTARQLNRIMQITLVTNFTSTSWLCTELPMCVQLMGTGVCDNACQLEIYFGD